MDLIRGVITNFLDGLILMTRSFKGTIKMSINYNAMKSCPSMCNYVLFLKLQAESGVDLPCLLLEKVLSVVRSNMVCAQGGFNMRC